MARTWIQASPSGNGIGIHLLSDGLNSLTVVVYPKVWDRGPATRRIVIDPAEHHGVIALAETQIAELVAPDAVVSLLSGVPEVFGDREVSPLLAPTWKRAHSDVHSEGPDPRLALLGVVSLITESGSGDLRLQVEKALARHAGMPQLRPVLIHLFISELRDRIRGLRRGYVAREEAIPYLRGRPREADLVVAAAAGLGPVRCEFDDFVRSTPLLVGLATTLEVASQELAAHKWWGARLRRDRDAAVVLRRALADVASVPQIEARRLLRQIATRTRGTHWEVVVRLAEQLLSAQIDLDAVKGASSVEIRARPSRIWETMLGNMLRSSDVDVIDGNAPGSVRGVESLSPWQVLGSDELRPDLYVWLGNDFLVVDAKYKTGNWTPSSGDSQQAFAYSHLVFGGERGGSRIRPSAVGIFYPSANEEPRIWGPFLRRPDDGSSLWVGRLPFPSLEDCGAELSRFRARASAIASDLLSTAISRRAATGDVADPNLEFPPPGGQLRSVGA